jgi:hypothetical protein
MIDEREHGSSGPMEGATVELVYCVADRVMSLFIDVERLRAFRVIALAAAMLASAGCGGSTSPDGPSVITYTLVSIDGANLPTPDKTQPASSTIAGTIVLVGTDSAEIRQTLLTPAANGNPSLTINQLGFYSVSRGIGMLVFQPHTVGVGVDTASASGSQLLLRRRIASGGPTAFEQLLYIAQ